MEGYISSVIDTKLHQAFVLLLVWALHIVLTSVFILVPPKQLASTPTIGFLGNSPLADPVSTAVVFNNWVLYTGGLEKSL